MLYIALLRAINVGGHNIKMEDLRKLFEDLGFLNVRSYIQTGNIFFESKDTNCASLTDKIEKYLFEKLGYEVATFLRTLEEIESALNLNPFKDIEMTENMRQCIVFLSNTLPDNQELPVISPKKDIKILKLTSGEALVLLDQPKGKASNPSAFIEKTFKVKATTRFFATTQKILDAAKMSK
jgi:uncharacterized protein (DUF1697 family)